MFTDAETTLSEIRDSAGSDPQLEVLLREMLDAAVHYAHLRARWRLAGAENRRDMDRERTIAHEAFIDSLNILSRNVAARERDNRWRRTIGDERKLIGDFACAWAALLGIEGR